jgi:hypothetical protein
MKYARVEMDEDEWCDIFPKLSKGVLYALVRDFAQQEADGRHGSKEAWLWVIDARLKTLAANEIIPRDYANKLASFAVRKK